MGKFTSNPFAPTGAVDTKARVRRGITSSRVPGPDASPTIEAPAVQGEPVSVPQAAQLSVSPVAAKDQRTQAIPSGPVSPETIADRVAARGQRATQFAPTAAPAPTVAAPTPAPTAGEIRSGATPAPGATQSAPGQLDPQSSSATSRGRGVASPEAQDVIDVNVPVAGLDANTGQFETVAERQARYLEENAKQQILTFDKIHEKIQGIDSGSAAAFDSRAVDLSTRIEIQAKTDPRIAESMVEAGIMDADTGWVKADAARTMLFVMANQANISSNKLTEEVLDFRAQLEANEITEEDLSKKVKNAVLMPDIDKGRLESSVADEFQMLFGGVATDEFLRTDAGSSIQSPLSQANKPVFNEVWSKMFEDIGFIKKDSATIDNKKVYGFKITDEFNNFIREIGPVLDEYSSAFRKDVTLTPNVGGVPSGQAAAQWKQATKTPKRQRAKKGEEVYQAMDAMGTTPMGINSSQLGANAAILAAITKPERMNQKYGISTHPLAEHFLMGSGTFMKFFKSPAGLTVDNQPITSFSQLETLFTQIEGGVRSNLDPATIAKLDTAIKTARLTQSQVSKSYLRAFSEAAALNNQTYFHTQSLIAGNSRNMVRSTVMNYQSNKKARELVGPPQTTLIDKNKSSGPLRGWKMIVARNLVEGADRVGSSNELLKMFDKLVDPKEESTSSIRELAKWLASNTPSSYEQIGDYAKGITDYRSKKLADPNKTTRDALAGSDPNFPMFPTSLPDNDIMLQQLSEIMGFKDPKSGEILGKSDEAGYHLMALIDLGKFLNTPRYFQTQITAEADGISNGLIIQAAQFGEQEVASKGGIIYERDADITPNGDMRQHIHNTIVGKDSNVMTSIFADPLMASKWESAYTDIIVGPNIKGLHKLPVMTTPYGMDADYHQGSIVKFLNSNPKIKGELMSSLGVDENTLVDNMAKIESAALKGGLGDLLTHQGLIKNAHQAAVAANEILSVKGANGWDINSGGFESEIVSEEEINFGEAVSRRVQARKVTGSPYAAAKSKGEGHRPTLGTQGRNQSAVFGTQNIDATVAQRTIVNTKAEMGDGFFGAHVYDAFIGDVNSFEKLVDNANYEFERVNKEYSMVDAEIDAVQELRKKVKDKVMHAKKNGLKFDVSPEGEYKGMFELMRKLSSNQARAAATTNTNTSFAGRRAANRSKFGKGFKFDGSMMTPDQFMEAYDFVVDQLQVESSLKAFKQEIEPKRRALWDKVKKQKAMGRPIAQYR